MIIQYKWENIGIIGNDLGISNALVSSWDGTSVQLINNQIEQTLVLSLE